MKSNKLVIASLFSLFYAAEGSAAKKGNKDLFGKRGLCRLTGKVNYVGLWKPWFTVSAGATLKNVFFGVGATKHFEISGRDITAFCKFYPVDRTVVGAISGRDKQYFKKMPLELGASTQFFGLNLGVSVSASANSLKSRQKVALGVFGSLKPNERISIDIQGNVWGDSDFLSSNPGVNSDIKKAIKDFKTIAEKFESYVKSRASMTPEVGSMVKIITDHAQAVVDHLSNFQEGKELDELKSSSSLILGRPGSGKTHAAHTLLRRFVGEEGLSSVAVLSLSASAITPTGIVGDSVKETVTRVFREGAKGINPLLAQLGYLLFDEFDSLKKKANEQGYKADVQKETLEIVEGGQEIDVDGVKIRLSSCCRFLAGAFEDEQTLIEKRVDAAILENIASIPKNMLAFLNSYVHFDREAYEETRSVLSDFGEKFAKVVAGVQGFSAVVEEVKRSEFKLSDGKSFDYVRSLLERLSDVINEALASGKLDESCSKAIASFRKVVVKFSADRSFAQRPFFDQVYKLLNNGLRLPEADPKAKGKFDFMYIFDCAAIIYRYSNAGELIKDSGIGTEIARRSSNTFYVAPLNLDRAVHAALAAFRYHDSKSKYDGSTLSAILNQHNVKCNGVNITRSQLEEYVRSLLKGSGSHGYFQYKEVFDSLNREILYIINNGDLELRHQEGGLLLAKKTNYVGNNGQFSVVELEHQRKHVKNKLSAISGEKDGEKEYVSALDGKDIYMHLKETRAYLTRLAENSTLQLPDGSFTTKSQSPSVRRNLNGLIAYYDKLLSLMTRGDVFDQDVFDKNIDGILSNMLLLINRNAPYARDKKTIDDHYGCENDFLNKFIERIKAYHGAKKQNDLFHRMNGDFEKLGVDILNVVPENQKNSYKICINRVNSYGDERSLYLHGYSNVKLYNPEKEACDKELWSNASGKRKEMVDKIFDLIKRFEELREEFYKELSKIK